MVAADDVIGSLEADIIPAMQQDYPGLRVSFEGEQQQQTAAFGALGRGFVIALFIIYMLLAIPFRSYIQPFIIMAAIPFGFIGAVLGHLLMGLNMSILSLIGVIGLSGVVVNDALVLIDFINERRRSGIPMAEAIREAGKVRPPRAEVADDGGAAADFGEEPPGAVPDPDGRHSASSSPRPCCSCRR